MSKRLDYVDIAKGLAILLVILGHIKLDYFSYCGSVHIPLFFVAAGYLCDLNREEHRSYREVVGKRSLRLLAPYFIYSMLLYAKYLLKLIISSENLMKDAFEALAGVFFSSSILYKNVLPEENFYGFVFGNGPLWFLTAMVIASIIFYAVVFFVLKHKFHPGKILISMILLTGASWCLCHFLPIYLPWSFEMAVLGAVFMLFGMILRNVDVVEVWRQKPWRRLWVVALSIPAFAVLHHFNGMANMAAQDYGKSLIVYLILGMLGAVIIFYLAVLLEPVARICQLLTYIGQNTLVILALHMTIISMMISVLEKLRMGELTKWGGFFIISFFVGLVVPLVIKKILVRLCPGAEKYL